MKLGNDVLLEIVDIVRTGLLEGKDISDMLREVDLEQPTQMDDMSERVVCLSREYKKSKGRVA